MLQAIKQKLIFFTLLYPVVTQGYQTELIYFAYTQGYQTEVCLHLYIWSIAYARHEANVDLFTLLHHVYTQEYQAESHLFNLLYPVYTLGYQAEVCLILYILSIRKDIRRKLISVISCVYARISRGS
jgi:hypothetical protein